MAQQGIRNFDRFVNSKIGFVNSNSYINSTLKLFLALYAGIGVKYVKLDMAPYVTNPFLQTAVFFLIIWSADQDVILSLALALAFLATTRHLTKQAIKQVQTTGLISQNVVSSLSPFDEVKERPTQPPVVTPSPTTPAGPATPAASGSWISSKGATVRTPNVMPERTSSLSTDGGLPGILSDELANVADY